LKEAKLLAEPTLLDRTFSIVMKGFVETGQAPHYTEIAAGLGVSPREGRHALRKLFAVRAIPGWLYPKVDTVVSLAPFNNLPTQYRITIDGEQKWFAQ
jgi:hypothetical protein